MMSAMSIGRIALPFVAIVAGCGLALISDFTHLRRESAPETRAPTAASTPLQPASSARDERSLALAAADTQVAAVEGLVYHHVRQLPLNLCPSSTLPALNERAKRSSLAGQRQ